MTNQTPEQINMFTGKPEPTKAKKAKPKAVQMDMFAQKEIAQFGAISQPSIPLSANVKLGLFSVDPRTADEKKDDLRQQENDNNLKMEGF